MEGPQTSRFPALTRRGLLLGGAGLVMAAACGGDDDTTSSEDSSTTSSAAKGDGRVLVRTFADGIAVSGAEQRLVFTVADAEGVILADVPARIDMRLQLDGDDVGAPVEVQRRGEGIPRPYYPLVTTFEEPGIYTVSAELGTGTAEATFTVSRPDKVEVVGPGDGLVPVVTPTTADARGVTPICTREPICPLHDVTLQAALEEGRPIALLIATPEFCQTAVCGPVLDVFLGQRETFAERVRMMHAEVYENPAESTDTVAEVVRAHKLTFEPVLYLAGADGVVRRRLDNLYDESELRSALDELVA